jgi:hypothetical protein
VSGISHAILIEEDMVVSPDFLRLFEVHIHMCARVYIHVYPYDVYIWIFCALFRHVCIYSVYNI